MHCSNEGVISIDHSGQVLYATMDEALDQDRKELRKRVRVAITKHYEGQSNASEQALRTIRKLNMNDSDSENKGREDSETSHTPENSAYKLIAWIVLLEPETNEDRTALLADFADKVEDGYYQSCSLFEWDADKFTEPYFMQTFISSIKADAYLLSPEMPLESASYSANYGAYEPLYSDHTGVDFVGGSSVYASHSGTIVTTVTGVGKTTTPSYGNHIVVQSIIHDFWYAHLENSTSGVLVEENEFVLTGKKIGTKGALSGYGSGPHLHFEARPSGGGYLSDIDPYNVLPDSIKSKDRYYYA